MQRISLNQWLLLGVMALFAGLSYWMAQHHLAPMQRPSRAKSHRPDAIAHQVFITILDQDGATHYQMRAAKILHYEDDGTTEAYLPILQAFTPEQPNMTIKAVRGVLNDQQTVVDLYDRVHVMRARSPDEPEMEARSTHFRIFMDEDRVQTEQPVQLRRGASVVNADGMHYAHLKRLLHLEGHVRGMIQPSEVTRKDRSSSDQSILH